MSPIPEGEGDLGRAQSESRPVRKLRLEPFDDVFADASFARDLVTSKDETTAENVGARADEVFASDATAYSLGADSAHFATDWLGDGGENWLGSGDARGIFATAFRCALEIAAARDVPVTALWVPLTSEGKGSVSVAVSPTCVTVVIVSTSAGAVKMRDIDFSKIWQPHDPRILHFSSETIADPDFSLAQAVDFFGGDLPTQDAPGDLYA